MTAPTLNWVKLRDRRPRVGQRCLLFVRETGHIMDGYHYPRFVGGFCTDRNRGIPGVSEWMPYPK